ncbi:PrsW family intramembrane metalloprotease [Chroococcidiopsis sp. FACHB-1243]|uniref:PrsW family glutamic-type intramembrane protease n=1 Tax=Chroococcidiopsis sp. [FACHB-1243] TaxID=2692781 RepID=UPI001781CF93|nr:PrsW family glutamic-type intramembrane protease [Chroococcidiopsis sp. [FACHB-1243]]MBD2308177.1 PrsW family intramembrane metalloprotease [Chroococcidiopsis sp. [FACHB-1243]]
MTEQHLAEGWLRLLPNAGEAGLTRSYSLSPEREMALGRDPACDIVLESEQYGMVSRHHATFYPLPQNRWQVCDMNSSNGTFINGQRLQGCRELVPGDRITLGEGREAFAKHGRRAYRLRHRGAEFIFESHSPHPSSLIPPPVSHLTEAEVNFSHLFPIISTAKDLTRKAYLIPGIFTVIFVVLMFATVGQPKAIRFNQLLVATYLSSAAYYFIYRLCGKIKPWWLPILAATATALILFSPILPLFIFIFRRILPGNLPNSLIALSFPELFLRMFVGAGLMEEFLKALPVLGAYALGRRLASPWREWIGVWEPLDGILLGTASAVGFTLVETLWQYVPEIAQNVAMSAGQAAGQIVGLQLLIPRIIGAVAGHMADSGYFGYFIGLSVLKPRQRWQILTVGYVSAAALHALWNSTAAFSGLLLVVVGILSYAFLTAAILKARMLSPTRSQNFATRFLEKTPRRPD